MTEQKINRRLGNQENINNWDKFWEIYFDEVNHNNYQQISLKVSCQLRFQSKSRLLVKLN